MEPELTEQSVSFDSEEAKKLLRDVQTLFRDNFGIALPEMSSHENIIAHDPNERIELFEIKDRNVPIYDGISSRNDAETIIDKILRNSEEMAEDIETLIDNNDNNFNNDSTLEALEMISNQITKFNKAYRVRRKKVPHQDSVDISNIRQDVFRFLEKIVRESLIGRIIPAISMGMEGTDVSIYKMALETINSFLAVLGIHTVLIRAGDKVEYDWCYPVDAGDNRTDDYQKRDIIKEVKRLPYIFDKEHIVSEGEVVVWRVENGS